MLSNKKSHSLQQPHQDESKLVNSIVQLRLLWGKHLQSQWKHHRIAFALLSIRDSKEISSMFHLDRLSHQLPVAFVTSLKDRRLKPDFPENFNRTLWQVAWSCGGNIKPWQYFLSHNVEPTWEWEPWTLTSGLLSNSKPTGGNCPPSTWSAPRCAVRLECIVIGPRSDHSLPLSVTDSLTHSLTDWRPCWKLNELT